jgi:hypothetical protein
MTRLVWTIHVYGRIVAGGTVLADGDLAERVALDALAEWAGRNGVVRWDMAGVSCTVADSSRPDAVIAVADGRNW